MASRDGSHAIYPENQIIGPLRAQKAAVEMIAAPEVDRDADEREVAARDGRWVGMVARLRAGEQTERALAARSSSDRAALSRKHRSLSRISGAAARGLNDYLTE